MGRVAVFAGLFFVMSVSTVFAVDCGPGTFMPLVSEVDPSSAAMTLTLVS
jgi:hypothetical protein